MFTDILVTRQNRSDDQDGTSGGVFEARQVVFGQAEGRIDQRS
jgi:hypothetical protein